MSAAVTAIQDSPDTKEPSREPSKRSKSRLRELAAEVDKLQDQLGDLDDQRAEMKKRIAGKIKAWNEEAAKRK
jgi:vacuolar-type H+-ATPase subunit I/STV1